MRAETATVEADNSTRERILAATAEVLGRNGMTKLSLSEVAPPGRRFAAHAVPLVRVQARTARRVRGVGAAVLRAGRRRGVRAAWPATDRLEAALRIIVEYQQSYPGLRMVDIEPEHVIRRMAQVLPLMRQRLET